VDIHNTPDGMILEKKTVIFTVVPNCSHTSPLITKTKLKIINVLKHANFLFFLKYGLICLNYGLKIKKS
jgi:hypothetical protein